MRLSDLVHRSALRNRTAGDAEVSSFSPKVFEVTDLTIPAGTDWGVEMHMLGQIEVPPARLLVLNFYLEMADPVPGGNRVDLAMSIDEHHANFGEYFQTTIAPQPDHDPATLPQVSRWFGLYSGDAFAPGQGARTPDPGFTYWIGIMAMAVSTESSYSGPTNDDMTVAHARCAVTII